MGLRREAAKPRLLIHSLVQYGDDSHSVGACPPIDDMPAATTPEAREADLRGDSLPRDSAGGNQVECGKQGV